MAVVRRITTSEGAQQLARDLLSDGRKLPVVVITATGGDQDGLISAEDVAEGVGELAEVCWMPTGEPTWAFAEAMPDMTQVFGNAARVYALDPEWRQNPRASKLHLCGTRAKARGVEEELIAEAMQAAAQAGLLAERVRSARTVAGVVKGFPATGRAWIDGEFGYASVREELVTPGVPIERILSIGQTITGRLDERDRLLDLSESLLTADQALTAYEVGDVVPARVRTVGPTVVAVELHPTRVVDIGVARVTGDPSDDLRDLMSLGEIVPVRIERTGKWILSMLDVEDVEPMPACSLLRGGPPWIEIVPITPVHDRVGASMQEQVSLPAQSQPDAPSVARPPVPGPQAQEVAALREAYAKEREQSAALQAELNQLRHSVEAYEAEVRKSRRELEHLRTERRRLLAKARKGRPVRDNPQADGAFVDPQEQLRHDVYLAWVRKIPAGEKASRPLPADWTIGDQFVTSLEQMSREVRGKVPEVIVEVLLGIADRSTGRQLHQLRTGTGGDDPIVHGPDNESCWRVAVQLNTPAAARLHFWRASDGRIALSRVVPHDDMKP